MAKHHLPRACLYVQHRRHTTSQVRAHPTTARRQESTCYPSDRSRSRYTSPFYPHRQRKASVSKSSRFCILTAEQFRLPSPNSLLTDFFDPNQNSLMLSKFTHSIFKTAMVRAGAVGSGPHAAVRAAATSQLSLFAGSSSPSTSSSPSPSVQQNRFMTTVKEAVGIASATASEAAAMSGYSKIDFSISEDAMVRETTVPTKLHSPFLAWHRLTVNYLSLSDPLVVYWSRYLVLLFLTRFLTRFKSLPRLTLDVWSRQTMLAN